MQGDDISGNPSFCKEILGGVGTPFEVNRPRTLPCELRINQLSSMFVGSSIMVNAIMEDYQALGRREEESVRLRAEAEELVRAAREGTEQLEKDRAAFEKHKQTEEWAATAELKQELTNAKAANAALVKEKAAAVAVAQEAKEAGACLAKALEEAKEAEARDARALEGANVDRTNLTKTILGLQCRPVGVAIEEVLARAAESETRAREAAEARDSLTSSLDLLKADREWMRMHGIGHIVTVTPPKSTRGVPPLGGVT
ncbi:hypothetical protein Hdeb2414_s0011g00367811 [Helianthus debilis subsp. tardiflorus]